MSKRAITGVLLDEQVLYSLQDVCRVCGSHTEWVVELVEQGILQPTGARRDDWQFPGSGLHTAMRAHRLQRDLDLNLAGVALALDLLDEIEALRSRINALEELLD
jgi:chaperone modulatory protein CbpM